MSDQSHEGAMKYHVEADVSLNQMREWPPARIQQFFHGLAIMLSAIAGIPRTDERDQLRKALLAALEVRSECPVCGFEYDDNGHARDCIVGLALEDEK